MISGPNNNPIKRIEVIKNTNNDSLSFVSGDSLVCDSSGKYHTIDSIFENFSKTELNENFFIECINEESLRIDLTRINSIIKQSEKKPMIRFSLINGYIDVSKDRKMMVNREGKLVWVNASQVVKGDLFITPKFLQREIRKISWKEGISVPYESFKGDKITPHRLVLKIDGDTHEVGMPSGFNLCMLYYVAGLIDACGWIDKEKNSICLRTSNWNIVLGFCKNISNLFLIEPEISGDKKSGYVITINNKIALDILSYAISNMFHQEDEYIGFYLSGFLDGSGKVINKFNKQSITFYSSNKEQLLIIKKCLHVFGIISAKQNKNSIYLEYFDDLKQFILISDCLLKENIDSFAEIIRSNNGKENPNIGYILGSLLTKDRNFYKMGKNDFGLPVSEINKYEKGSIVSSSNAWAIAEKIMERINPSDYIPLKQENVSSLISSDIIGIKVLDIENVEGKNAYDIDCLDQKNFFVNNILSIK